MIERQAMRDLVRRLAGTRVADGCVLSVYVSLDPREFATARARSSATTSVVDEASRRADDDGLELSHKARAALREDVERVRAYIESADLDGTRGLAIFAAGGEGLFEALHLPHPVENAVVVDDSPYVAPLAPERDEEWCVLLANRRDARILRGNPYGLVEEDRISDEVPGQHDQGGWSQARYARSIDQEATRHLERTATELARRLRRAPFDHLLAGGPEEAYAELVELLAPELRERLRGRVEVDVENTAPAQVLEAATPLMREHERRRRDELLERLAEGVGTGDRAAAGLEDVLEALNEQRVEVLLLDAGFSASGRQCPNCRWIGTGAARECPADGTLLEQRADVVEPASERALAQDAEVVVLRERPELDAHGGIAALLRF